MTGMTFAESLKRDPPQTEVIETNVRSKFSEEAIEEWLFEKNQIDSLMCCLVYGKDGTGKSGIVFDYLTDEDIKENKKAVIIDLDGGCLPLLKQYHGTKVNNILVKNPIVETATDEGVFIDYNATFSRIRATVMWVRKNWKKHKIKFIVFDGLSTALKHAEYQMRMEKSLDADGGVQMRYWLIRNKIFMETLEQIKSLPVSVFFIAHEDFILKEGDEKPSSIKEKTNSMMHQKIRCTRTVKGNKVTFKATIDKSKYNICKEAKEVVFCEVDKTTGKFNKSWNTRDIFEGLV